MIKFYALICMVIITMSLSSNRLLAQVYANSQTNGVTGLCLLCNISSPDNAINNTNLDDYTTFNLTAGLLGVTVYQTLIFPSQSTATCDSLIIGIGSGNALLSVNLLGGVSVQTFNGTTANNDLQIINTNILRLLQTTNKAQIILKPQQAFDRVKITLSSSLLGVLSSFQLYYAYRKPAVPAPNGTDSLNICQNETAIVTATAVAGATVRWYSAAIGGTLLSTGNTYTVTPSVTTTYFAEAEIGGCKSLRKPVKVIVNPKPAKPVYTVPSIITCGNTPITVSNHQPNINYNIRVRYTSLAGTLLDTSYAIINTGKFIVPDINAPTHSQATVWVQAVNSLTGCKSDSVQMSFVYGGHATLPRVRADSITICKFDSTTLQAFIPNESDITFRWYDAPTAGHLLYTGPDYRVSPQVTTTYYVSAAFACEYPVRKAAKVIVKQQPNPIYSVPQGILCSVNPILIQNHQAGLNYNVRLKGIPFSRDPLDTSYVVLNSNSIAIPPIYFYVPALVDIYIQAVNPLTGCRSDSIHQTFTIGGSASLPEVDRDSITLCKNDSITLHAFIPNETYAIFRWYDMPLGGNLLFTGGDFKISPASTKTYYVTAAFECENPRRRPVKVIVVPCNQQITPRSTDKNGSAVIGLQSLQVYPNPTNGEIRFTTDKDLAGGLIVIKDLNGREVHREILRRNGLVLSKHMATGLYFFRILTTKATYAGSILLQQ
ncbi:Ig-like domain-containing protein [Chitinophaga nivalis]|uniref:T9SS type A sorting domain-containing protein n=1 Tax=Chitinophaga nivalis TaxID=2991709 RepID=A0ABT3IJB3_9BACT|nr:T9SS type A sorting domain-containing protein [Chitinophaga nivalis]MCW3466257.1 T9SS type A sorting domain-containing protein [Chitinophaga nivalis]MCW3484052.1 T9SS type A sorting domain-containing protein [Chitinophaga nivalis]